MRPNSHQLAMRDPALASIMGALPGSDFGAVRRAAPRASAPRRGTASFGDMGFGFGFGAEAPLAPPPPHVAHHAGHMLSEEQRRALHHHEMMQHHTMNRAMLLDPNRYSTLKVQGYSFSLNQALVIGAVLAFNVTLQPNSKIRPKRMVSNVPSPAMVTLSAVQVANVNVLIGASDDAYIYSPNSFSLENEFPTLDTSTRATMTGGYSGYAPVGFSPGFPYLFALTFQGPAALAGNG
jgi:hypothetical protein